MASTGLNGMEKMVLAYIQERQPCTDSNNVIGIYFQMTPKRISEIIQGLQKKKLIMVTIEKELANKRTLRLSPDTGIGTIPKKTDSPLSPFIGIGILENTDSKGPFLADLPINSNNIKVVGEGSSAGPVTEKPAKKSKTNLLGWFIKMDVIYLTYPTIWQAPEKNDVFELIATGGLNPLTDQSTAFLEKNPPTTDHARRLWNVMLMPYGLAKYFHSRMIVYRDPAIYKSLGQAKTENWIDQSRLLLYADKRPAQLVKDVMLFMFEEDEFWRTTIWSIDSFRSKFDKILGKMQDFDSKKNK